MMVNCKFYLYLIFISRKFQVISAKKKDFQINLNKLNKNKVT